MSKTTQITSVWMMSTKTLVLSSICSRSVASARTWRVKSKTKPCFNVDVLYTIGNRNEHYKKIKRWGKEIYEGNFQYAKCWTKKVIDNKKKNFTLKEKLKKMRTISKKSGEL